MKLIDQIFSINSEEEFEKRALEVFHYQIKNCVVYRDYVQYLDWPSPTKSSEIPFLPIDFFKTHEIISIEKKAEITFKSSGTGGTRSKHYVAEKKLYERSFRYHFEKIIGDFKDTVVLALLPNYIEQGDSSLVYMVNDFIQQSNDDLSGFILNDFKELHTKYSKAIEKGKNVILFGVSYALIDLAESKYFFPKATVIETGGMKGQRKEITKAELHQILRKGLNTSTIYSEYGMTELLSQAYSTSNEIFKSSPLMKVLIRETNDPFSYVQEGKTGGINVIDLCNLYSCSFIATQDLGKKTENGFKIMGRFDHSDVRGCNLLVQ